MLHTVLLDPFHGTGEVMCIGWAGAFCLEKPYPWWCWFSTTHIIFYHNAFPSKKQFKPPTIDSSSQRTPGTHTGTISTRSTVPKSTAKEANCLKKAPEFKGFIFQKMPILKSGPNPLRILVHIRWIVEMFTSLTNSGISGAPTKFQDIWGWGMYGS